MALKPAAANVPTEGYNVSGKSDTESVINRLRIPLRGVL